MELKSKIADAKERLDSIGQIEKNKDNFISAVRKFMEMEELTAPLLKELIERIEVNHIEGVGKIEFSVSVSIISLSGVSKCLCSRNVKI